MSVNYSAVLVRYGEIGIKSRQTRKRMSKLLATHIASALKAHDIPFTKVKTEYGRLFVMTDHAQSAAEVASRVFGVVSTSPVVTVTADMGSILETGLELARQHFRPGLSFAVGARRMGEHDFTSQDVRRKLGALILEKLDDLNLTVDLSSPEQSVYVEVRDEIAYLFVETVNGVGGMPTGSQGKVVCVIDGTLSSLVAAFRVMKRGAVPVFLIFIDSIGTPLEVHALVSYIHGMSINAYLVPHPAALVAALHSSEYNLCIVCRRNMIAVASEFARMEDADAIVTGDIIGEPGRTTYELKEIRSVRCEYPVLQPCAGDDPIDVIEAARAIGVSADMNFGCPYCPSNSPVRSTTPPRSVISEIESSLPPADEQALNFAKATLKNNG